MRKIICTASLLAFLAFLCGCGAQYHASDVKEGGEADNLTVGKVQREIRVGMTGGQVAEVLGSPNIVSTDEKGREVWIYDKISTDKVYSKSSGYGTILILGGGGEAGASSTTQRTLTIIVKYDEEGKVRDIAYHSSKF